MKQKFLKSSKILQIKFFGLIFLVLNLSSCALFQAIPRSSGEVQGEVETLKPHKTNYSFVDQAGEFFFSRESGYQRSKNQVIVKRQVLEKSRDESSPLERSITISNPGRLNNIKILRPEISQYSVWFDGQRYFTQMNLNEREQGLDVVLESPENDWNGEEFHSIPDGNGLYCFFSQVVECAKATGFSQKAVEVMDGQMAFYIIWEGYPYIQEQYPGIPNEVFTRASFSYDGLTDQGMHRFALNFAGQTIFYHLNEDYNLDRMFWVAQGLSITPI